MTYHLGLSIVAAGLVLLRIAQRVLARRQRAAALATGGFRCPVCGAARLVITESLALPGDTETAAIDLEALACRRCDLRVVGVRAAPSSHRGYAMPILAWGELSGALRRCPAPRDRECNCATHVRYGLRDQGAWRGLDAVPHDASEPIILT
ncbi:Hypothetical protein A7982_06767 [Minicystis rosea]|nr:Hypothetical protein A7982_06767 [Minicystis rosea]